MNTYVTGTVIKALREQKNCTQQQLADQLHLSAKTISKWETGKGLPDITLLEPLAALGGSVIDRLGDKHYEHTQKNSHHRKGDGCSFDIYEANRDYFSAYLSSPFQEYSLRISAPTFSS